MINPISSSTQADAASATESATPNPKALQAKPLSSSDSGGGIADTVTISSAAQAAVQLTAQPSTQTTKQANESQQAPQLAAQYPAVTNETQASTETP